MTLASPRRRLACRTFSVFAARPLRETRLSFLFRNARWRWCRGRWRLTCGTRPLSDDRVLGFSPFFFHDSISRVFFFHRFSFNGNQCSEWWFDEIDEEGEHQLRRRRRRLLGAARQNGDRRRRRGPLPSFAFFFFVNLFLFLFDDFQTIESRSIEPAPATAN